MVSIHPRLFRRGNKSKASTMNQPHGFNPPPPFQAREPRTSIMRLSGVRFQSTPAFSGEGTDPTITIVDPEEVSIHPRLFRRGNDHYYVGRKSAVMFQSTPAFSGEGTKNNTIKSKPAAGFNPPPPFQAREPRVFDGATVQVTVSIHPRLFRRGNDCGIS